MEDQKKFINSVKAEKSIGQNKGKNAEDNLNENPNELAKKVDGKVDYVIHKISPNDTLAGISIRYNVRIDMIRRANEFTGDEIFFMKELIIPYTSNNHILINL